MSGARTSKVVVEKSLPQERLDVYLRTQFPAVSRGALQRLMQAGHIRVNAQVVKPTYWPRAGDQIEIYWPEARPAEAAPVTHVAEYLGGSLAGESSTAQDRYLRSAPHHWRELVIKK